MIYMQSPQYPITRACWYCQKSKIKKNIYRTFSLMWPASMQIYSNKRKRLHLRKEVNSQRTTLEHQHGCCFIVLEHHCGHCDLMWKCSMYSRTPVTQTLKGNKKQFELAGNSSYRGKFQWNFIKGKEILFKLARNSSYLSLRYRGSCRMDSLLVIHLTHCLSGYQY